MRVVFVTREVWPFVQAGGIGRYVSDAAAVLAGHADVTVLTTNRFEDAHWALAAADDPRLADVQWRFAPEPAGNLSPFLSHVHAWSATVCEALRELCLAERPDIVEFEDYGGAAAVTLHAAQAGDPAFRDVRLVVRAHTTWEMTQILDGMPLDGLGERTMIALERESVRLADALVGPAATLAAYRRHYGPDETGRGFDCPPPFAAPRADPEDRVLPISARLRLLFVGRMQRLKGVEALVRAFAGLDRDDLELTLVGGDTDTAPGGGPMLERLRLLCGDDPRITFLPRAERPELARLMRAHHVVVVPSRFESFSYVVREALAANRPVLAADVGGVATAFEEGRSGWLIERPDAETLAAGLEALADDRDAVEALIRDGIPRATMDAAASSETYLRSMLELAAAPSRRAEMVPAALPPVSAVVTACAGEGALDVTLATLEAQRLPELEIVVAAEDVDLVPARLLGRINELVLLNGEASGANACRAAGLAARRGDGPVLMIRSGERLAPGFLARALVALERDARLAYATAYARGRTPGNVPIGNAAARLVGEYDVAATVALLRDGELPLAAPAEPGRDDRALFDTLADRGRFGAVIPEWLVERRNPARRGDAALATRRVWETLARVEL